MKETVIYDKSYNERICEYVDASLRFHSSDLVTRIGFWILGNVPKQETLLDRDTVGETVTMHQNGVNAGLSRMVALFKDRVQIFNDEHQVYLAKTFIDCHDIAEYHWMQSAQNKDGLADTPDDGRDTSAKDEFERKFFKREFAMYDKPMREELSNLVDSFLNDRGLAFYADKINFCEKQAYLAYHKKPGDMLFKKMQAELRDGDLQRIEKTGSTRPVDNIYFHVLGLIKEPEMRQLFIDIMEEYYKRFDPINGVPKTIRSYY